MDLIFAQAYVTLCAASSPSCHIGFLTRDAKPTLKIRYVPSNHKEEQSHPAEDFSYLVAPYDREFECTEGPFSWDYLQTRWYQRGWVHQEIELSQRLLIFGHDFIHFKCPSRLLCENGHQSEAFTSFSIASGITPEEHRRIQDNPQQRPAIFDLFRESVEHFYAKRLTYETDRLPAIAGLARKVSELTGSRYHAGLFQDTIHSDLVFKCMEGETRNPRLAASESYLAPSWSWVSTRAFRMAFPDHRYGRGTPLYASIQVQTTLSGLNPFGEVQAGLLTMETKVLLSSVELDWEMDMEDAYEEPMFNYDVKYPFMVPVFNYEGRYLAKVSFDNKETIEEVECVNNLDGEITLVWALVMENSEGLLGLLLQSTGKDGEYFRIGMFHSKYHAGGGWHCFEDWEVHELNII
ncbi:MAG: hypothetical protein LQ346_008195 [Caloplaca aetnensis]|nr:MAG: hypothetical protein LQ346_008195 [Caloplaca aetnensis]